MLIKTGTTLIRAIKTLKIAGVINTEEYLKEQVTLRIGGRAEVFIRPLLLEDLKKIVTFADNCGVPLFILGGGSKVLLPDEGLRGITLKLDMPYFKKVDFCQGCFRVGGGLRVGEFLRRAAEESMGGWEFLAGMPATIAGALVMNAGVRKNTGSQDYIQFADFVEEFRVMDKGGNIFLLNKNSLNFGYRESGLADYIILDVKLSGAVRRSRQKIQKEIERFLDYRRKTQELSIPNAGCVFKNPAGDKRSSGELIESAGLKGRRIGDIVVSDRHANFILNMERGSSVDFLALMELIQKKIKLEYNIWLEPEIKIIRN